MDNQGGRNMLFIDSIFSTDVKLRGSIFQRVVAASWECRVVVVLYVHTVTPGVVWECSGGGCVVCTYSDTWCCLVV